MNTASPKEGDFTNVQQKVSARDVTLCQGTSVSMQSKGGSTMPNKGHGLTEGSRDRTPVNVDSHKQGSRKGGVDDSFTSTIMSFLTVSASWIDQKVGLGSFLLNASILFRTMFFMFDKDVMRLLVKTFGIAPRDAKKLALGLNLASIGSVLRLDYTSYNDFVSLPGNNLIKEADYYEDILLFQTWITSHGRSVEDYTASLHACLKANDGYTPQGSFLAAALDGSRASPSLEIDTRNEILPTGDGNKVKTEEKKVYSKEDKSKPFQTELSPIAHSDIDKRQVQLDKRLNELGLDPSVCPAGAPSLEVNNWDHSIPQQYTNQVDLQKTKYN